MKEGMQFQTADDVVALTLETITEQQNKLQALLEQTRSTTAIRVAEQRNVREQNASVAVLITRLEGELALNRSSEIAFELMTLRDQQRSLQQQEVRLADQVDGLAGLCRKLRLAIRENQTIAETMTITPSTGQDELVDSISWRVAQAQEEERQRLAREIHDGPAQALANAVFELEFCERLLDRDTVKLRLELTRLKDDLRQSLADVRHFIFGLRPGVLSELGLGATLKRYAQDFQARCEISLSLQIPETLDLSSTHEVAIFRIVQEALQNARKHSKASHIDLILQKDSGRLVVTIKDNGEGFDFSRSSERSMGHFGLRGMHERARLIGGQLHVSSELGVGTIIKVDIPEKHLCGC